MTEEPAPRAKTAYYHGLCGRYGAMRVERAAFTLPLALHMGFHFAVRPAETIVATAATAAVYGLLTGFTGMLAGMGAHSLGNVYASRHGYGLSRGSALVRKFQAAAYAVPLAGGLALAALNAPEQPAPPAPVTTAHTPA